MKKIIGTGALIVSLFGLVGCGGECCKEDVSIVKSDIPTPNPTNLGAVVTTPTVTSAVTPTVTPSGTTTNVDKKKSPIPPTAVILVNGNDDFNITVKPCQKLYFDSNSTDEDGNVSNMSYDWTQLNGEDLGHEKSFYHRFRNEGDYEVTLTVTDEQNLTSSDTIFITVKRH